MHDEMNDREDLVKSGSGGSGAAEDEKLRSVLRAWQAPGAPPSLDARVITAYRRRLNAGPLWKRLLTATIPVPAPVAVIFVALLLAATLLAVGALHPSTPQSSRTVSPMVQTRSIETPEVTAEAARGNPSASTPSRETGVSAMKAVAANAGSAKPASKMFVISLQSDQGTVQGITESNYRFNPTPKIYAGGYFKSPAER